MQQKSPSLLLMSEVLGWLFRLRPVAFVSWVNRRSYLAPEAIHGASLEHKRRSDNATSNKNWAADAQSGADLVRLSS